MSQKEAYLALAQGIKDLAEGDEFREGLTIDDDRSPSRSLLELLFAFMSAGGLCLTCRCGVLHLVDAVDWGQAQVECKCHPAPADESMLSAGPASTEVDTPHV